MIQVIALTWPLYFAITMTNTGEGVTTTNTTLDCILHEYRVWSLDCSESMIFRYKWISLVLGLAFTIALSFHFKNLIVRLIQSKFKIEIKEANVRINILSIMASICGMLNMSNYYGYHHSGYCVSAVSNSLCTSFLITIA